jgi:hypothetical protein
MDAEDDNLRLERTDSIANRDDPIPVLRIPSREEALEISSSSEVEAAQRAEKGRKRERLKDGVGKIKDTVGTQFSGAGFKQSLGDRLVGSILTYVVPSDVTDASSDEEDKDGKKRDRRSRKYVDRPNFNVGLMTTNFRRFNARIGIVFVLQNRLIYLFTWRNPTATLSFLSVYSLLCLNPHLVPLVPLAILLFYIMIPSFVARHPVPTNDPRLEPSYRGPAVAPASRVKPAPDLSKDFMRNMRDLQNCMEDFSRLHDAANEYVTPYTNFSDERMSSTVFLFFFVLSGAAFIGSSLVPWRFIALVAGWLVTTMGHENAQAVILSSRNLRQVRTLLDEASAIFRNWIDADVMLDEPPEKRQVEIFELQKHHPLSGTWEAWLFSPTPFDPLSPLRIAGARAKGTQFFEDVQPPTGWGWKDKKWTLDLASREWVDARMITGVEVETEGERWVYDLAEEEVEKVVASSPKKGKGKRIVPVSGWEESLALGERERGEWRRRRWVRVVERKGVGGKKGG